MKERSSMVRNKIMGIAGLALIPTGVYLIHSWVGALPGMSPRYVYGLSPYHPTLYETLRQFFFYPAHIGYMLLGVGLLLGIVGITRLILAGNREEASI